MSLSGAFSVYWDDMKLCRDAKAYWCLLHVTICLPDICAALQAPDGETGKALYIAWCDEYLKNDPMLSGADRYQMRCKVLHQGRSKTDRDRRYAGPYTGFAFGQPSSTRRVDHDQLESGVLHLDVGALADEMKLGVESWIAALEADQTGGGSAVRQEEPSDSRSRVRFGGRQCRSTDGCGSAWENRLR